MSGARAVAALTALAIIALTAELLLSTVLGHRTGVLPLALTLTLATLTVAATEGHLK